MKKQITLPKKTESVVLEYLDKNVPKYDMSENMRVNRVKILNKEWTVEDWSYMLSNFTEKELIRDCFGGDRFAFDFYKKYAHDKIKMSMLVSKGLDPHHLDDEDLSTFYADEGNAKAAHSSDHEIVRDLEKERLGTRGLDYKIDMIIMNLHNGAEFTPEGLQSMAEEYGYPMTLQNARLHTEKLNRMLRKVRMMDPRKTGIVDMENEFMHQLKKHARNDGIDAATANMIALHGKKMISAICYNMGRNVADSLMNKDRDGRLRNYVRAIKNGAISLGLELNDVASQLINSGAEEEAQ